MSESKANPRRKRADPVAERLVSAVTESLGHLSLGTEAKKERAVTRHLGLKHGAPL